MANNSFQIFARKRVHLHHLKMSFQIEGCKMFLFLLSNGFQHSRQTDLTIFGNLPSQEDCIGNVDSENLAKYYWGKKLGKQSCAYFQFL